MPLPRRSAPAAEQAAAAGRVRALLGTRAAGWTLPEPEGGPDVADAAPGPVPAELPVPASVAVSPSAALEPVDPVPAGGGAHRVPGVVERLRAGRLDPGRRAVAGLAVVALLACLLAGALVLRSAPREVALPAVERAGAAVEGATVPDGALSGSAVTGAALPGGAPASGAVPPGGGVAPEPALLVVAVAGEVRRPGLVRLPPGSRVDDALRAAGGLRPGASPGLLNLARRLVDGEQVLVGVEAPPGAAVPPAPAGPQPAGATGSVVDLNAAGVGDLDALPGIGPVLAQRIVDHRTRNGPFRSVDQLREVSGIGEAKFASLRDQVRV